MRLRAESLSPQQLYEELKESPFFYPTKFIEAKSPTAKTVILLGDNHTQPSSTFRQLQILSNLGIRDVGIEGWCGKETDEKRGARILNANIDLINKLLQSSKFNIVGVEDPKYQDILKLYGLLEAFNMDVHYAEDAVDRAAQKNREKQIQRIKDDLKKMGYSEEDLTRENILQKLQKHADGAGLTLEEYHAKVIMELREKFSVDKLKEAAEKSKKSYMIMIYGLAHIPNLPQTLHEAGFNVIVLKDPYDLEHLQYVSQ